MSRQEVTTILDRIKWEITPPLPPIQWWIRAKTETRHFPHLWIGGRGGLNFSFEMSKIAILDRIKWEITPPLPPIQWWIRAKTETRHFPHLWIGGRGGLNFSFEMSKIAGWYGRTVETFILSTLIKIWTDICIGSITLVVKVVCLMDFTSTFLLS